MIAHALDLMAEVPIQGSGDQREDRKVLGPTNSAVDGRNIAQISGEMPLPTGLRGYIIAQLFPQEVIGNGVLVKRSLPLAYERKLAETQVTNHGNVTAKLDGPAALLIALFPLATEEAIRRTTMTLLGWERR